MRVLVCGVAGVLPRHPGRGDSSGRRAVAIFCEAAELPQPRTGMHHFVPSAGNTGYARWAGSRTAVAHDSFASR